MLEKVGIN